MSMSTSRDCGPSIVGRTHVENDVLSRETPIGSGSYRARAPIRLAIVFAAMLELSIVRADAQTLEAPPSIEISSPTHVGDVHIRDGAEITVIKGGSLTGSPNPIWEIGDVHGETGTLNIEGGDRHACVESGAPARDG